MRGEATDENALILEGGLLHQPYGVPVFEPGANQRIAGGDAVLAPPGSRIRLNAPISTRNRIYAPVGFAYSGGLVFVDESADEFAAA
jgi:hypothetical protein